jgi:exonuclease SbcC
LLRLTEQLDAILQEQRERRATYYQEVLAPLNVLERRFVRALTVRTPFDVSLSQRTSRGATQLDLTSRFDGQANSPMLSAAHLLSEGQLAATAFTQVVSMSTAYRWSAWPALLLDDPVQHNDVLHVSAFVDLLRNLVRDQAYQVVLSTHDPEIANFISRKLRSDGGIDQLTCHFEGLGEGGVTYRAV